MLVISQNVGTNINAVGTESQQFVMQMEHTPYTEDDLTITTTTSTSPHSSGETHPKSNPQSGGGTRHPVYRGVRKRRWGKWVSEIREPRKKSRIWLGSFPVPEMAAKAYDVAAYCLKGRKAQLNFPEELEHLPRPSSCTARDIQAAAAKAAHMKRSVSSQKNDVLEDSGGDGDDFWGEIELPELINNGCYWNSCGWTTTSSSSSFAGGGDASSWPDGEATQPFMACL